MVMEAKGDVRAAAASYRKAAALAPPYDWQGSYRLWRALAALEEAEAADREEEALRRRWGEEQFRWCAAARVEGGGRRGSEWRVGTQRELVGWGGRDQLVCVCGRGLAESAAIVACWRRLASVSISFGGRGGTWERCRRPGRVNYKVSCSHSPTPIPADPSPTLLSSHIRISIREQTRCTLHLPSIAPRSSPAPRYMSDVDGAVLPSVQATEPAVA
jgi:hypothetical protein